jgi:outer membrane protein assembly factor BamE (lipoprotein component of BamABCDE complex)
MRRFFFLIILTTSCVSRLEQSGYMFDLSNYQLLQENITTRDKTLKLMGSPTIISNINDEEIWIYFSEKLGKFLFFKESTKERKILTITFENDTIKKINSYNLLNQSNKGFTSDFTKVESQKEGLFSSIFSNIGSVKAQ